MANPLTVSSLVLGSGIVTVTGNSLYLNGGPIGSAVIFNPQTTSTYLVTPTDSFNVVAMSGALTQTVILPSGTNFVPGVQILIERYGTGIVNIGTTGTVRMQSRSGVSGLAAQFSVATAILRDNTTWLVGGDLQ